MGSSVVCSHGLRTSLLAVYNVFWLTGKAPIQHQLTPVYRRVLWQDHFGFSCISTIFPINWLFADDCVIYAPVRDSEGKSSFLQDDLIMLEKWQDDWMMQFNPSKCATMSIATRNPTKRIYDFCGQQLESDDSHPYLGVEMTNTLNWGIQTSLSVKKAQRAMGVVKRNLADCNQDVKVTAYQAIVRPLLEYAMSAWDPHGKGHIKALETV